MIWLNDIKYAKAWKIEIKEKFVKASISTSEKKQDNTYENSYWNVAFIGKCLDEAKQIQEGDVLTITKGKLTNVYNKEKKQSYLNMTVFEFTNTTEHAGDDFGFDGYQSIEYDDPDSCPF